MCPSVSSFFSLSTVFSRFIHDGAASALHSFSWPSKCPLCGRATLLMLSSVGGHLGSFQLFGCYAAVNIHVHLFVGVWFSILCGCILGVGICKRMDQNMKHSGFVLGFHVLYIFKNNSKMMDSYRMGKSKLILDYSI